MVRALHREDPRDWPFSEPAAAQHHEKHKAAFTGTWEAPEPAQTKPAWPFTAPRAGARGRESEATSVLLKT